MKTARWLGLVLLVTACSGAGVARDDRDGPDPDAPPPRASGAVTAPVPPPPRVPDGAIDRVLLDRVLAAGPGWLLSQVPLQPTFLAKHKFNGFKILSLFGNDPKVLRYGVQPGDTLRAINGQRLVTPTDLMRVFERLKTADLLEIAVERDGVERILQFPIVPALGLAAIASPQAADATATSAP